MGVTESFPRLLAYLPNQYVRSFVVLLVCFLVFRLLLATLRKIFIRLTSKTKTDIDDILLKKSSVPMHFVALSLSLIVAVKELVLSDAAALTIDRIIYTILVISIGYMIYVFVDIALVAAWNKLARKSHIPVNESLNSLVEGTLIILVIVLVIIYILDLWGVEIVPILGALGVAGLAVALALQPVLSNIFSGVSLIMDKSVKVGDRVVLDMEDWGIIEKIGIRSTRVKTANNEVVIIPNTKLAESNIKNTSLPEPKVRRIASFSVAYGSDLDEVRKIVLSELRKIKSVLKDPEPSVRFMEFGSSSLNFNVYFYIEGYDVKDSVIDEVNSQIYKALRKNKIEIPFPQLDVYMKK